MSFLQFWHKEVMVTLEERKKKIAIRLILPTLKRDCLFRRFSLVFLIWSKWSSSGVTWGKQKSIFLTDNYIKIQVFSTAVLRVLSIPVQPLRLSPDWVRCAACDLFSYSQAGLAEGLWEQLSLDRSLCPHTEPKIRGVSAQMLYPSMLYPKEQHFSCNIFLSKPPRKQDPQLSAHCFFLLVSRDSIKVGASLTGACSQCSRTPLSCTAPAPKHTQTPLLGTGRDGAHARDMSKQDLCLLHRPALWLSAHLDVPKFLCCCLDRSDDFPIAFWWVSPSAKTGTVFSSSGFDLPLWEQWLTEGKQSSSTWCLSVVIRVTSPSQLINLGANLLPFSMAEKH